MKLAITAAVLAISTVAAASPPYTLGGLLVRAETVALVTLDAHAHDVTLTPATLYRGAFARAITIHLDGGGRDLPDGVTQYVALSQGDTPFGPPTDAGHVGQGGIGQRGYRGWLLYPVRRVHGRAILDPDYLTASDGTIAIDRLAKLIAAHPYRAAGE